METNEQIRMPRRTPVEGTFELTVRCNLHCGMCLFRHADSENETLRKKELTASQWTDMGRQATEAGTLHLLITGGEPMIRSDFCEIWESLYGMGFLMQLYTNATLVTPQIMETLTKCPPHQIGITIYGASEEIYEKVCGSRKAFNRMKEGVKQLQKLPSIMDFRTTIIRDNYADIENMERMVREEFHSDHILTQTQMVMKAVRGGCADVAGCRLSPKQNVELYFRRNMNKMRDLVGAERFDPECVRFRIDPDAAEKKSEKSKVTLFGCHAGMSAYTITYEGKLLGCQIFGQFCTDALADGFQKAWAQYPCIVERITDIDPKCQECPDAYACWSCPASRYAETGDLSGWSDYVCQTTKEYMKYIE